MLFIQNKRVDKAASAVAGDAKPGDVIGLLLQALPEDALGMGAEGDFHVLGFLLFV